MLVHVLLHIYNMITRKSDKIYRDLQINRR